MSTTTLDTQTVRRWTRYPEYRPSEASWLPTLPTHWQTKRLKYLGLFAGGGTPAKENPDYWNGDIPWVSPKDIKGSRVLDSEDHITASGLENSSTRLIPIDSVLIVARSGILKHSIPVAINVRPVALNQDLKAVIPGRSSGLLPEYLSYLLQGHQSQLLMEWKKEGTTVESLELELIANTQTPLPPVDEQRAIAAFLDRETARIDALIGRKERLIALLEDKRQTVISHAVTRGLDPTVSLKDSGVSWLGTVPEHWEIVRAKFLFRPTAYPVNEGDGVVTAFRDGQVTLRTNRRTEGFTFAILEVGYQGVRKGQLVIHSMDAFAGAIGVSESDGKCSPEYIVCRPLRTDVAADYYAACLREMARQGFIELSGNAVRERAPRLRFPTFGEMALPVPPRGEQHRIADHVRRFKEAIAAKIAVIRRSAALVEEYRTALISSAVTGQIDVRGEVTQ